MREKSVEIMNKIKSYTEEYCFREKRSPTIRNIGENLGISKSSVSRYLMDMDAKGIVSYNGKSISTPKTQITKNETICVPIIGNIHCGFPTYEEENFEEYVALPESIFGAGELFILRARGDSMKNVGIQENDLVVVKKQGDANAGDVVVALVDGETTLKTLYFDEETNMPYLHPENETHEDIKVFNSLYIQGVAQHVIKRITASTKC